MVVRSIGMDPSSESQRSRTSELKFGMDKILSTERKMTPSCKIEDLASCSSSHQCSGCLYNSLRCNPSSNSRISLPYYRTTIHAPQALRPYTNVLIQSDTSPVSHTTNTHQRRKRSWSRAVFSNLQRKGLEKRFQLQKYITKPDRRQLAATLGLTDAQVKVWFQNRRMKWRHTKEGGREEANIEKRSNSGISFAGQTRRSNSQSDDESDSDVDVQTVDSDYDSKALI